MAIRSMKRQNAREASKDETQVTKRDVLDHVQGSVPGWIAAATTSNLILFGFLNIYWTLDIARKSVDLLQLPGDRRGAL